MRLVCLCYERMGSPEHGGTVFICNLFVVRMKNGTKHKIWNGWNTCYGFENPMVSRGKLTIICVIYIVKWSVIITCCGV